MVNRNPQLFYNNTIYWVLFHNNNIILCNHTMNYLIVIENESPPPPQVLIPNTGLDNSVNFTSPTLTSETVCNLLSTNALTFKIICKTHSLFQASVNCSGT